MAFKELKTKIALRYLDFATWSADSFAAEKPLKGEVWFCEIPSGNANATTAPTMLFKVGDGVRTFGELKWASALAADVYAWAKASKLAIEDADSGNVITGITATDAGIKVTRASVATSDALAQLTKRIDDNQNAWALDTDTRYSFSNDGDKLVVKKALYTNGVAGTEETVGTYEFLSEAEVRTILGDYYTKAEADAKYVTGLAEGSANGTVKAVINGVEGADVAVHGLQDAAYVTVASLNATAKGYADAVEAKLPTAADYGVLSVAAGDDTITVGGTAQNPTVAVAANKFDAYGEAAKVLGTSADAAAANTVYGAKAAAAAAQGTANEAKTKIDTFLGTITPDGSKEIIDTLQEINTYVGEHGEAFAALSGKVTNIEDGTTHTVAKSLDADAVAQVKGIKVDAAANAEKLNGQSADYYATAQSVTDITKDNGAIDAKIAAFDNTLGDLAKKDNITHDLVTDFDAAVKAVKVDAAVDADKLGGKAAADYALKTDAQGYANTAEANAKGYADGLAGNYATAAQGTKADNALQEIEADTGLKVSVKANNKQAIAIDEDVIFILDCNY